MDGKQRILYIFLSNRVYPANNKLVQYNITPSTSVIYKALQKHGLCNFSVSRSATGGGAPEGSNSPPV
jgi:hypothetical protein